MKWKEKEMQKEQKVTNITTRRKIGKCRSRMRESLDKTESKVKGWKKIYEEMGWEVRTKLRKKYSKNLDMQMLPIILGFVSPCIIIYSNKSTNQMHQSLRFIARRLTLKSPN